MEGGHEIENPLLRPYHGEGEYWRQEFRLSRGFEYQLGLCNQHEKKSKESVDRNKHVASKEEDEEFEEDECSASRSESASERSNCEEEEEGSEVASDQPDSDEEGKNSSQGDEDETESRRMETSMVMRFVNEKDESDSYLRFMFRNKQQSDTFEHAFHEHILRPPSSNATLEYALLWKFASVAASSVKAWQDKESKTRKELQSKIDQLSASANTQSNALTASKHQLDPAVPSKTDRKRKYEQFRPSIDDVRSLRIHARLPDGGINSLKTITALCAKDLVASKYGITFVYPWSKAGVAPPVPGPHGMSQIKTTADGVFPHAVRINASKTLDPSTSTNTACGEVFDTSVEYVVSTRNAMAIRVRLVDVENPMNSAPLSEESLIHDLQRKLHDMGLVESSTLAAASQIASSLKFKLELVWAGEKPSDVSDPLYGYQAHATVLPNHFSGQITANDSVAENVDLMMDSEKRSNGRGPVSKNMIGRMQYGIVEWNNFSFKKKVSTSGTKTCKGRYCAWRVSCMHPVLGWLPNFHALSVPFLPIARPRRQGQACKTITPGLELADVGQDVWVQGPNGRAELQPPSKRAKTLQSKRTRKTST